MNYKLRPSDLTFLYDGCKRCFYLTILHQISQPSIPLPAIFTKMDSLLKNYYKGKRTEELHPDLPPGIIKHGDKLITSRNLYFEGHNDSCFIRGLPDIYIEFDDGKYGVIDFKISNPEGENSDLYSRQLHGYAYTLENPAPGSKELSPVSMLGLLYFYPSKISQQNIDWLSYDAEIQLVEIERNDKGFILFIEEILSMLESPNYPTPDPSCKWCRYIDEVTNLQR